MAEPFDVAIIGGGPGGYVTAIRAGQLGLKAVLFEKERVGGLCVNWGCIPSKALLKNADVVNLVRDAEKWGIRLENPEFDLGAAIDRSRAVVEKLVGGVETLLKENGVTLVAGEASIAAPGQVSCNGETFAASNIVIATGAQTRMLPGVAIDGNIVITSREALEVRTPPARVVIIGAGPVGMEFAHLWASYGSQVTVVELLDRVLPLEDADTGRVLRKSFAARGITVLTGARVEGVTVSRSKAKVTVSTKDGESTLEAEAVLVAIGFVPHTAGLNLETLGVATERGFVTIGDWMETNVPGVYAIGDVTGKLMLAHTAMAQGVTVAETVAGRSTAVLDYQQIPRATFCQPQAGSVGFTEEGAKAAGYAVKSGRFPLTALGRAVASGHTEGFVKVVADAPTGQVLGIHMVGHDVNDLLGEAALATLLEATTVELGFAVHAHPTLAEAIKEAALAVTGEAIHIARVRLGRTPQAQGVAIH